MVCLHNLSTSPVLFPKERGLPLLPQQCTEFTSGTEHDCCFRVRILTSHILTSDQAVKSDGNEALEYRSGNDL